MLTKITPWADCMPVIKKRIDGADVSEKGNFAFGECPEITVEVPRKLGASAVVMRICKDGQEDIDYPFSFYTSELGIDVYKLMLDTAALCDGDTDGLFFYEILFLRGLDTLFTSTENNVDLTLRRYSSRRFTMLVYSADLKTPEWFKGRTMYQIFVDRFHKGEGSVGERDDVIINGDWYGGTPQYAERPGDDLKNNMFFGGNLWGVIEKLDYLKSLGVGVIYLNPIFKAYSNHKYDTANYLEIDSMFGGKAAFDELVKRAAELDIKLMLDGVFNHTGDNSLYFDRYGEYGGKGAYGNPDSEYHKWYRFKTPADTEAGAVKLDKGAADHNENTDKTDKTDKEEDYESWWGIKILPRLDHECDACRSYFTGENGVGAHYIREGVSGWRLDVADELSDRFLDEFCASVKRESGNEAVIIGEVWENAVTKEAYGKRRKYLRGAQLDSVMNYPLRTGILNFVLKGDSRLLSDTLRSIYSVYPKAVCDSLMNILGTHDTERALTVFGKGSAEVCWDSGSELAIRRLTQRQRTAAIKRLIVAAAIQYTVYGVPSLYYGDEAGLEGYHDPFCRYPFPWGREDARTMKAYRRLGQIRESHRDLFAQGGFKVLEIRDGFIAYERKYGDSRIVVADNVKRGASSYKLAGKWRDLLGDREYDGSIGGFSCVILEKK